MSKIIKQSAMMKNFNYVLRGKYGKKQEISF